MSSANYVYSHRSEAGSLCCGQDEEHEDEEECTSTQKSLDDQPLACRWHQTRAGGVMGKTSSAATSPPTQSGGAESGEADDESACGDAEVDSNDLDGDGAELIPKRALDLCAQQATSSRFQGAVWNVYSQRWVARIISQGVVKTLGWFDDKEAAARAYDEAAIEHGLLDQLNFNDYELPETASASSAPQRDISRFQGVSYGKTCRNVNPE
jgi:hypothetical protein